MQDDIPQDADLKLGGAEPLPDRRSRRVWPVFVAFFIVLVGVLVGSAAVTIALLAAQEGGMPPAEELPARLSAVALTAPSLIGSVAVSISLLLSTSLLGATFSRQPLSERLRLRKRPVPPAAYLVSIVGLLVVGQSVESAAVLLGFGDAMQALNALADAISGMSPAAFAVFVTVGSLGAGFAEELFFRGYMQTRLTSRWGMVTGVVVSAAAFGILHLNPMHSTVAFFMGLYLGWLVERSGTTALSIVAHAGNNLVAFTLTRLVGDVGNDAPGSSLTVSLTLAVVCVLLLVRLLPRGGTHQGPARTQEPEMEQ